MQTRVLGRSSTCGRWHLWVAAFVLLCGCGQAPIVERPVPRQDALGQEIAVRALSMIGAPYAYGAQGPTRFDCSGLVHFIHRQLGIEVPRTAAEQHAAASEIEWNQLAPGDLLFFRINGRTISHVAIYAGDGRFVHAPQTGRPVEIRTLDDEFYRPRLVGVGRFGR